MKPTVQQIKELPIAGNAYHDNHIFQKIDNFVTDPTNSINEKADLLRWMESTVMGCENDPNETDEEVVSNYLEYM